MSDISVFAQTNIGRVRKGNEDSFLVVDTTSEHSDSLPDALKLNFTENNNIFMVADGMGGPVAGEVASLLAVDTVLKEMKSNKFSNESDVGPMLVDLLQKANSVIFERAKGHSEMKGMGTTATLAAIINSTLFLGQVGDSRAYIIRKNSATQVTKDQSYVNQLIESGVITEEEAEKHPQRNIILQALGTQISISVALTSVALRRNDYLLLCSDGLSGLVKKEEMQKVLLSTNNLQIASKALIDLTNKRGGHDNITLILAHFPSNNLSPLQDDENINCKIISKFTPST